MVAMPPAFKTVALIGRYKSRDVGVPLRSLAGFLAARGCTVLLEQETAAEGASKGFRWSTTPIGARADLAVVLGGDGTMPPPRGRAGRGYPSSASTRAGSAS
jgi:NAD+ kinase